MDGGPVLLYDGNCGFCKKWVRWAQSRGAQVDFKPCQEETVLRQLHGISDSKCEETAIFIDGRGTLTHAHSINAVLKRMPGPRNAGYRFMGHLGSLAIFWPLGALGYRLVAKNRHRLRGPKA